MPRTDSMIPLTYSAGLLLLLGLGASGCPTGGSLDDDDVTADDDDDGDDDDDDDDDDDGTPEGIAMSGEVRYQPATAPLPTGAIRAGLFSVTFGDYEISGERWSTEVSEGGLLSGSTVFTIYVDEEPAADLVSIEDDTSGAMYLPFSYADGDGDGAFGAGDVLLGSSETWLAFIADTDGKLSKELVQVGAAVGWNTVVIDFLGDGNPTFASVPEGTNSNNGPELRSKIIPIPGGDVPLTGEIEVPVGSNVAAFHVQGFEGPAVPQQFTQPVSNPTAAAGPFAQWAVGGAPPPADHIYSLRGGGDDDDSAGSEGADADLMGAAYIVGAWWDGENDATPEGACDLTLGLGGEKQLAWVQPPGENLELAFWMHLYSVRPGWLILEGELPRLLASGITFEGSAPGDDDDSAGGSVLDELPEECQPAGDDDDSAGDDDDSAP